MSNQVSKYPTEKNEVKEVEQCLGKEIEAMQKVRRPSTIFMWGCCVDLHPVPGGRKTHIGIEELDWAPKSSSKLPKRQDCEQENS